MESHIGSTTTTVAVADEVRLFKGRTLDTRKGDHGVTESSGGGSQVEFMGRKPKHMYQPEPLSSLCLKVFAKHFATRPLIQRIPDRQITQLTALLDVDLDIRVAAAHVYDENYWRRKAMNENWKLFEIANHGLMWKQLYFEKKIAQLLEDFMPEDKSGRLYRRSSTESKLSGTLNEKPSPEVTEDVIMAHLQAAQDYVFQLKVTQMLSHINVEVIFNHLPNLNKFELSYGVKGIGMRYDRSLFGLKMSDATALARSIKNTCMLSTLALPCNLIDDDLLRMLMSGLISNHTVTALNLSHNKITNHGMRLLSKLLGPKSVLTILDLSNNSLHVESGRYLGRALERNKSLLELNLRLNRLTDEGGSLLLEGLEHNNALTVLNISSNSLASKSTNMLVRALNNPASNLIAVNVSCNEINEESGQVLVRSLKKKCNLVSLDTRKNHLEDSSPILAEIVKRAELNIRPGNAVYL